VKRLLLSSVVCLFIFAFSAVNVHAAGLTHKVKSGENLHSIAKKYHVSVNSLKSMNSLKSINLKPGQVLVVKKDDVGRETAREKSVSKKKTEIIATTATEENDGEFIEYKTKKGDTLDRIASLFNIEREDILESNNIKVHRLRPGTRLLIPRPDAEEGEADFIVLPGKSMNAWKTKEEPYMLVKVAKSFVGAPYKMGGESVRGLDCSAFVKKIYDIFDVQLPRSAREQYRVGSQIRRDNLSVGDLVFFKTRRYAKYPTHVGIYIGDGNFIHSSSGHGRIGVKVDPLSSDYYSRTYIGATRVKKVPDDSLEKSTNLDSQPNNNS